MAYGVYGTKNPAQAPSLYSPKGTGWGGDNYRGFGMGSALGGGVGSLLGSLFGGGDISSGAFDELNQIPEITKKYLEPYIQSGQKALPTLEDQLRAMREDPTAVMKRFGSNYTASPGYKFNVEEATRAANQAAAAGGMLGSPAEQAELAKHISGLASQDYNDYINKAIMMHLQGLSGASQGYGNIYQTGANTAANLADTLANLQSSKAQLAYADAANRRQSDQGFLGGIGSLLGGLGGLFGLFG